MTASSEMTRTLAFPMSVVRTFRSSSASSVGSNPNLIGGGDRSETSQGCHPTADRRRCSPRAHKSDQVREDVARPNIAVSGVHSERSTPLNKVSEIAEISAL